MTNADRISKAQAVVEAHREAVRACKEEVAAAEAQLSEIKRKLSEKEASLSVAERMLSIFEPHNVGPTVAVKAGSKRRMRLGAKKRAIYMLVSKQVSTIDQIVTHLTVVNDTDVDRRYIRDVVRDALSTGDMTGDIERDFIMTELGRDILEKAPIPAGWEAYRDAAEMRPSNASVVRSSQSDSEIIENERLEGSDSLPESNSEDDEDFEDLL